MLTSLRMSSSDSPSLSESFQQIKPRSPKTQNRRSKIFGLFKGSTSPDTVEYVQPPTPPPQPMRPLLARKTSIILPSHIYITVVFPTEGWLLDLRIAKVATSEHIWSQIALERKVEDRDSYGLFTEKGVMMANNIPAVHFKIKNKDMLTIKPRLKKDVKLQVRSVLNTFLKRRPAEIEIGSGGGGGGGGTEKPTQKLTINSALFHICTDYLIATEAYKHEGIFRLSPSAVELKVFFESLLKAAPDFSLVTTPNTVAAAMKQYIRSLSATLICHPTSTIMAEKLRDCVNEKEILIREFSYALAQLPRENLEVLEILFGFLLLVVSNTEYSKMTSRNLSIVLGPNIIAFDSNIDPLAQAQTGTEVIDVIISNWENIFGLLSAIKS